MDAVSLFFLFFYVGLSAANVCPPKEEMSPCDCTSRLGFNIIECKNILRPEDLTPPMRAIEKRKTEVTTLTIKDSTLQYLSGKLFENTHIKQVHFFNTEMMSLSDSDTAFKGLENLLIAIRAEGIEFVSEWDFDQLRNLKKLQSIFLNQLLLNAVDHPFPLLPELKELDIIAAKVNFITDDAFSNLPNLRIFSMEDNEITEMKRSMFPKPANSLSKIDLSYNQLSYLPSDFFENMPSLKMVLLDNNKFTTISEKPFSETLGKLQTLSILGNPLRCDCRMQWLDNFRLPQRFRGECSAPKDLFGTSIGTLKFKSLRCIYV